MEWHMRHVDVEIDFPNKLMKLDNFRGQPDFFV